MLLIKNARILTMAGKDYDGADILVDGGKISQVGMNLQVPPGTETLDASGKTIVPGYVDAHCHLGLIEDGTMYEGDDGNEAVNPVTPQLRAIDAINPMDITFREAYEGGITTVCTGPGSTNVLGGIFSILKTYGKRVDDMIVKETYALKAAFGEDPKTTYNARKESPMTRMAIAGILRDQFNKARHYMEKRQAAANDPEKMPDYDFRLENIVKVLKREIPLKVHVHRSDDIYTAIRIAREFDIDMTLDRGTEAHLIADDLKAAGYPLVLGPLLTRRAKVEMAQMSYRAPALISQAGLKFCIASYAPEVPIQFLPTSAGCAVRDGLDPEEALKAITIYPAQILGIADRVGSIEPGKDADIVIYEGHPFNLMSKIYAVLIDGKIVYQNSTKKGEQA